MIITLDNERIYPGDILYGRVAVASDDSLLSVEAACTLLVNTDIIKCELLLPEYRRPRIASQNIIAKNFHFLASYPAVITEIFAQREFDFALLVPSDAFPTISNSLILRVNWTVTAKLLPSGQTLTKSFTVLPLTITSEFALLDIQATKELPKESLVLRASRVRDSVENMESAVFRNRPNAPIPETLPDRVFDVKHREVPFCRISLSQDALHISFQSPVTSLQVKLVSVETIMQGYSQDSEELPVENTLKIFDFDNLKYMRDLSLKVPMGGPFLVHVQDFCTLRLTILLLFTLPDRSTFECQLPLSN